MPMDKPLKEPMRNREKVQAANGITVFLTKDMSENAQQDRFEEFMSACSDDLGTTRRFIISNTGTLLDTLKRLAEERNLNCLELENQVLQLLENNDPGQLKILGAEFTVLNLARMDNIETAMQLFDKILNDTHWLACIECLYKTMCPIALNIISLKESLKIARTRISYIYRRLYEYGKRLTMRQIAGHLAYAMTAGLDCQKIAEMATQAPVPDIENFLFYNRFFGFNGASIDEDTLRLTAVEYLIPLEMGAKPYPPLERQLWMKEISFPAQLPDSLIDIFKHLCKKSRIGSTDISPLRLRQQIRRLLYIYGDFRKELQDFIPTFFDSLMLQRFIIWNSSSHINLDIEMEELKRKVLHVLQEQYTGILLPESSKSHYLFITLKRGNDELRQTVQILLAKIPLSNFSLRHRKLNQNVKPFRYLLSLQERDSGECLDLELPFLDFVMLRGIGEIGQKLEISYIDRLERFKARLLESSDYRKNTCLELLEMTNLRIPKLYFKEKILQVTYD
jgi:hypothetical protein